MASAMVAPAALERSLFSGTQISSAKGLPTLAPISSSKRLTVKANKKVKVKDPFGPSGNLTFKDGKDASGRAAKGKGVYQFASKYGANVDGYSPIYSPDAWSTNGDIYTGGKTGLLLWAVTLGGVLLAGIFLVYNTSALSQ